MTSYLSNPAVFTFLTTGHCTCTLYMSVILEKIVQEVVSCRIRTLPLFVILLPVVAFWFGLHCGENHMLAPVSGWFCKRWWRELVISFFSGTERISIFSSFVEEKRQTSHTTVVSMVVEKFHQQGWKYL